MRTLTKLTLLVFAVLIAAAPLSRARAQDSDVPLLKKAIDLVQKGKGTEALAASNQLRDPAAKALVLWVALRLTPQHAGFDRAAQFLRERPNWPSIGLIRRRAEKLLYEEKRDAATVRTFFAQAKPVTGEGKLALARVLLASGDKVGALILVRSAWREDDFSKTVETEALATFRGMLERADHMERADRMFHSDQVDAALRAAALAGADAVALGNARAAVIKKSSNAAQLLEAVPASVRSEPGYHYARIQYRSRRDDTAGAAKLLTEAPRDPARIVDPDDWWRVTRIVARKLLDSGDARTAYRIARDAVPPVQENYKADQHFTAGWIALRYLKDPAAAAKHFARVAENSHHPQTLARGHYWQGRAAEAAGRRDDAKADYEQAARFTTAYYGQLARAKLGLHNLPLRRPVQPAEAERAQFARLEHVRALRLLYATDERELTVPFYNDLADRAQDATTLHLLAGIAYEARDPRGMVLLGKAAYARGYMIDSVAFPVFGIPDFPDVKPPVDRAVIYAIARQESQFNQDAVSTAKAYGLMQVISSTARSVAKRIGLPFDQKRLRSDSVYNARIGAAEIGNLLQDYRGSYILAFVGYNAGPSRAREWIGRFGDPRDPKVDPIDWVERVPLSETRFYIQRVMENLQVYRILLGGSDRLTIEADLARGRVN